MASAEEQARQARVSRMHERFGRWRFVADFAEAAAKPYLQGLENLPADGRFLLVANHVIGAMDSPVIMFEVFRHTGLRVRPLAHRATARLGGPFAEALEAAGVVVGTPEAAAELMRAGETILVFPGGAREAARGKDELHQLSWGNRKGFARLAVEHGYPIVPTTVVGADQLYRVHTTRDGLWGKIGGRLARRVFGEDSVLPLMTGIAGSPVPYPQRLYLRFAAPVRTARPEGAAEEGRAGTEQWVDEVRETVKGAVESGFTELLAVRARDPYRHLAPWARSRAAVAV